MLDTDADRQGRMRAGVPVAVALTIAALALTTGCKGDTGSAGAAGPAGPQGPAANPGATVVAVPSNSKAPTDAANAAWAALTPQVTVQGVTLSSPPVVRFKVTDATGLPVVGLGNTSKSSTATVAGLTNLAFAIAKLVPGSNGSPSKWVSYMVTTVPTTTAAAAPSKPSTDNTGTLTDNGDGTYIYTFYRDVPKVKDQVAAMTVSAPNNKDDLGDLTYDPSLVHRLTVQVYGNAPGTGTNTPTGAQSVPSVPLVNPWTAFTISPCHRPAGHGFGSDIVATKAMNATASSVVFPETIRRAPPPASTAAIATRPGTAWSATPTSRSTAGRKPSSTPL